MSYQKNCDRSDVGSARRAKNGAHQYRRSVFGLRMKDRIQTILLSNIRINYGGFLSRVWGGRATGISSKYVFTASCMRAFKRRKVKANKLKSESINSRVIGKLRSVAKWAQTFGSFKLFARAQGGRRYFTLKLFLDLRFAAQSKQALSSSARRYRILHRFRNSSLLYLSADALSSNMINVVLALMRMSLAGA